MEQMLHAPSTTTGPTSAPTRKAVMEKLLLTPEEAAEVLSVGRTTVYDLIRLDLLASVKIGKCRRVPATAVREYVDRLVMSRV